jgi:hypothetical protein
MAKRILSIIVVGIVLIAIALTIAFAQEYAEKHITPDTIRASEGHMKIMMDCVDGKKWARSIPVRVIAIYTKGDGQRQEKIAMMPSIEDAYITLHLPPEVVTDALQGLRLMYQVDSNERCEGGFGPGVWTQ